MTAQPMIFAVGLMKKGVRVLLRAYRAVLSPLLGPACRHLPSCSVYAEQAIEEWGLLKGSSLALRRLLRCHPFSAGGWDPVPSAPARTPQPTRGS